GTAALHLALAGLDVGPGDVCIAPAMTFLATATAVRFCGAEVVFADVDPTTGLMAPDHVREATARAGKPIKAVLPVHLGGRICDLAGIASVAAELGAAVVEDACHALGGANAAGERVGGCAHSAAACFSLHPVKMLAAGEGGMVTTNDPARAARMRRLANHGATHDPALMRDPALSLDAEGNRHPWSYEQIELGFNYRMNEMEAALGLSQLARLPQFVARRAELAAQYDALISALGLPIRPVHRVEGALGLHLYQVLADLTALGVTRDQVMRRMAEAGVQTQVHYIPVYRQPYFRERYGEMRLVGAEAFYDQVLALPLFPAMADSDPDRAVCALKAALTA
ncbi:MAG: DegT/DnrJ/EryC1/StrS family aminotransferase, partial [Caulobacteraceae bacterium]